MNFFHIDINEFIKLFGVIDIKLTSEFKKNKKNCLKKIETFRYLSKIINMLIRLIIYIKIIMNF